MNNKKIYNILLLGWYGNHNIGDDIMAEVTKHLFLEEAKKRNISARFAPFSLLSNFGSRSIYAHIMKNDLIVIGGGSILGFDSMKLYDSIYGLERYKLLYISKLSRNSKTPLVIFGGGFRKERETMPKKDRVQMKDLFARSILNGVRGPLSKDSLISNGIVNQIDVIGDPALNFVPTPVDLPIDAEFKIGMNIRFMKSREIQYLKNEETYKIFAHLADYFIDEGAHIYFFSFSENKFDSDIEAAKRTINLMNHKKNFTLIPFFNNAQKACSMIGKFDYLISQRLHPCIIGWTQKVPNIGFEYHYSKTVDFIKSIGMDEYVIRTDEFEIDTYLNKYDKIYKNRFNIINRSQSCIQIYKEKQKKFINRCLDVLVEN